MISFTLICICASGQVAPIKPGLWQIQMKRETNGQKSPDASERLRNVPPEIRAQVEASLKQRGIEGNGNTVKVCQTRAMLEQSKFVNPVPDCKTTYSIRTNSLWLCARIRQNPDFMRRSGTRPIRSLWPPCAGL